MNLKVLVWNMNYWLSSHRNEGWDFIREVNPDVAILNECYPPEHDFNYVHHVQRAGWGVGVFSQDHALQEYEIHCCHPEALVVADTNIASKEIRIVSLYGRIINSFAITTLHRSLSDLTPLFLNQKGRDWILIGGDFNASLQCDERMPSYKDDRSHYLFFERLKNFGLYDCIGKFHQGRVQTLRHAKTDYPWQNDYLYAGKALFDCCVSCDVVDDSALYEISDHNPIIADFSL